MRLIDADALMERYGEPCHSFLDVIEDMPTIDAVPVVHAGWEKQDNTFTRFQCTACKSMDHYFKTNFCPNCGARMDGDPDG